MSVCKFGNGLWDRSLMIGDNILYIIWRELQWLWNDFPKDQKKQIRTGVTTNNNPRWKATRSFSYVEKWPEVNFLRPEGSFFVCRTTKSRNTHALKSDPVER